MALRQHTQKLLMVTTATMAMATPIPRTRHHRNDQAVGRTETINWCSMKYSTHCLASMRWVPIYRFSIFPSSISKLDFIRNVFQTNATGNWKIKLVASPHSRYYYYLYIFLFHLFQLTPHFSRHFSTFYF